MIQFNNIAIFSRESNFYLSSIKSCVNWFSCMFGFCRLTEWSRRRNEVSLFLFKTSFPLKTCDISCNLIIKYHEKIYQIIARNISGIVVFEVATNLRKHNLCLFKIPSALKFVIFPAIWLSIVKNVRTDMGNNYGHTPFDSSVK